MLLTLPNAELRNRAATEKLQQEFHAGFTLCRGEQQVRCEVMEVIPVCGTFLNLWFVPKAEGQLGDKVLLPGHWYFVELSINQVLSAERPLTDGALTLRSL